MDTLSLLYFGLVLLATTTSSNCQVSSLQTPPKSVPELSTTVVLGIDCEQGVYEGWTREWLYWFDQSGNRLPTPAEVAQQERQRADQEQQLREDLIARLRARGIDPDTL